MNEMLYSGLGHFNTLINRFLANLYRRRGSRKEKNNTGDRPPPQQQLAPVGDGCHIAMLLSVAIVN